MKRFRIGCLPWIAGAKVTLATLLSTSCAFAESESAIPQREVFGASFEDYQPGDTLSDVGAVNGTWGSVAEDVAIAVEGSDAEVYMACSTLGDDLVFSPYSTSPKSLKSTTVSILSTGYESMDEIPVPAGAHAAFAIYKPENGSTNYLGWVGSCGCWTNLYPTSGDATPQLDTWINVKVKFLRATNGREYVQYWLKRSNDGDFLPLRSADDIYWFDAGNSFDELMVGKVGFSGEGGLKNLVGEDPRRGLILGIGSWYDFLFDETIYRQVPGSVWSNAEEPARTLSDDDRSYVIDVQGDDAPVTYTPKLSHVANAVEVTEVEVEFTGTNDDDSIPTDANARVRLVEDADEVCHFACLADAQWVTNSWVVSEDAKYTIEISLNTRERTVLYRYKEGYGLSGGPYKFLCTGTVLPLPATGKRKNVDFEGYGIVHEIRGRDKSE